MATADPVGKAQSAIAAHLVLVTWGMGLGCQSENHRTLGPTLVLGTTVEPRTLDPAFAQLSAEREIIGLIYRGLTTFDADWRIRPAMAVSLPNVTTTTTGAPRVHWRMRKTGWSDGRPVTSSDLKFGHQIEGDARLDSVSHHVAKQVASIELPSAHDARVTWKTPYADYAAPRVHALLPAHAYPNPVAGRPFSGMARHPVANGPFQIQKWVPGQWLAVVPNPHWTGLKPRLARIIVRFFPSPEPFFAELKTGGIDALGEASGLDLDQARDIAHDAELSRTHEVVRTESGVWLHVDLRLDHPLLGQLPVRQALSAAVDRNALAQVVYDKEATPAWGIFPPQHPASRIAGRPEKTDLRKAKSHIDALKLSPTDRRLNLQFGSGSPASERAATMLQAQWARLGLDITLEPMPLSVLFAELRDNKPSDMALYAWRIRPDWDGASALKTGGRLNYGGFSNPEIDQLLEAASKQMNPTQWARRVADIELIYRRQLPAIPLLFRRQVSVRPRRLEGWSPTGTTTPVTWNAEIWRFK